ncbi:Do family serine endopeptidase [Pelomonas sp. V22]|uniref:Do family serine endopeptidase n=1 Tax=Pelomonas sp. V22 TaxID=2822139 RepID=UPI0024A920DC|nr:Do family serine endopeptidase [Pelomonas sp. V22]MDI4632483.1 Do family serine endopeptidase [Pelomonas sp. V22]
MKTSLDTRTAGKPWGLALALSVMTLAAALTALPGTSHAQRAGLPDFTELVEKTGPAVVNIRTTEKARTVESTETSELVQEINELLQELQRRNGGQSPKQRRGNPRGEDEDQPQRSGVASGFILSADGVVMTNAHVVEDADEVLVTLNDKREFKARVIGVDRRSDVAVLKIEASGLPTVKIGDVGRLKVGEWVMAIGSPFGLENTVTAGIVSAKSRDTGDLLPLIQTDVAINPGNSGGPLLNMRGEVVGINSQIYSESGGFMGISFAIPIDEAMRVADQLRSGGKVRRGRMGLLPDDISKEVAEAIGLGSKARGALVRNVEPGSPAEKAGIEGGDVLTKLDGKPIERAIELRRIAAATQPGSRVAVQVFRRGAYKDLQVVLGEVDDDDAANSKREASPEAGGPVNALGLSLGEIGESQKRELKLRAGVRVESAEGPAARAGLRAGDLILAVDNVEVSGVNQLQLQLAKLDKAKTISMVVRRADTVAIILVKPGKP